MQHMGQVEEDALRSWIPFLKVLHSLAWQDCAPPFLHGLPPAPALSPSPSPPPLGPPLTPQVARGDVQSGASVGSPQPDGVARREHGEWMGGMPST